MKSVCLMLALALLSGSVLAGEEGDSKRPAPQEKEPQSKEPGKEAAAKPDAAAKEGEGDEAGDKPARDPNAAPRFTLVGVDGKKYSLEDFAGRIVVLEWVNHGCPYVKRHYNAKNMQALQEKYGRKGVVWLSICSSAEGKQGHMSVEEWKKKNEEFGVKAAAVLLDPDGEVGRAYEAKTTPQICVIDKKQIRVYDGAIDDSPRTLDGAKNYAAAVLDALLAGKESPIRRARPYGCSVKYAPKPRTTE